MTPRLAALLLAFAVPALAQSADGGTAPDPELQRELEKALAADKPADAPAPSPVTRAVQSLNPDISAIVDADFGGWRRAPSFLSGDDPDLKGEPDEKAVGFTVQEVELALSAIVDPYFKGEVYLTIPNLEGIEVEEAFATTTSLPWNLQVKAGSFRSVFGRQNGQHLHVQDFPRRPLVNAAFLGADGLRGPGAQVSWLAPLPFFLTVYGEALSIRAEPPGFDESEAEEEGDEAAHPAPVATFGAEGSREPTFVGAVKAFFEAREDLSVLVGVNVARGVSPGLFLTPEKSVGKQRDTTLVGGELYVKWKPPNVASGYASVAWQTEAMFRHFEAADGLGAEWDGGLYSQLVAQVARRWNVGLRGELVGLPSSSVLARTARIGASVTFLASEFARLRAYVDYERANLTFGRELVPPGRELPSVLPSGAVAGLLQLEISIGAHGAHPF